MPTISSTNFCPNIPTDSYPSLLSQLVGQQEPLGLTLQQFPTRFVNRFLYR